MLKRACFLFVLFFLSAGQVSLGLAKEPSFYEEFNQQEELKQEESAEVPPGFSLVPPAKNTAETQSEKQSKIQNKVQNELPGEPERETGGDFILTDEKHDKFLQENEQYALADAMLNQTWKVLTKKLTKKEYRKLWQKHKVWLDEGRNTLAGSFKEKVPNIPEYHAFMLATVAKTQELAQSVWHEPVLGRYVKENTFVTLGREEGKIFLQGYGNVPFLAKNTDSAKAEKTEDAVKDTVKAQTENPQEKNADVQEKAAQSDAKKAAQSDAERAQSDTKKEDGSDNQTEKHIIKEMPQLLFRAELPKDGKLWLALTTVNDQKLYLLTTQNSLCIVHAPNVFSFDFNGIFLKK